MGNAIQLPQSEADRLGSLLADAVNQAQSDMSSYIDRVQEYRAMLADRQTRVNPPWVGASELVMPYLKSMTLALMAHMTPTLLGVDPIVHYTGTNRPSLEMADEIEAFHQLYNLRYVGYQDKTARAVMGGLRDSCYVGRWTWQTTRAQRWGWATATRQVVDEYGRLLTVEEATKPKLQPVTVYDGPRCDLVPLERFGTFPMANADIQESPGVFSQYGVTGDALLQGVANGLYDAAAVERMKAYKSGDEQELVTAANTLRNISSSPDNTDYFRACTYQITEIYYRYSPKAEAPGVVAGDWLFAIHLPSNVVLSARPCPWWHSKRPFTTMTPYLDVEGFVGDSVASSGAGPVQESLTTLLRLSIDAMALGVSPETLVGASIAGELVPMARKSRGPGQFITVPDHYFQQSNNLMQPMNRNGYTPTMAMAMMEFIDRFGGQQSTGANDTMRSVANPSSISATEATQIAESSQKVLGLITERCADWIRQSGELTRDLFYQFQGNEIPLALWDELHSEKDFTLQDALDGSYVITSNGVRDTANKAIARKIAEENLAVLRQEPFVWDDPQLRYHAYEDFFRSRGAVSPERSLGRIEDWEARVQQAQGMAAQQAQEQAAMQGIDPAMAAQMLGG